MANPKEVAGRAAAEHVETGMVVGLGTGSTVYFTLLRLAERIRAERLSITGVPTSRDTEEKARGLGIPLSELAAHERIDLTIDGADEIDPRFDMIKGGGGALLREKVVAAMSRKEIIVVGKEKVVGQLGSTFPLPVEVVPFAEPHVARVLRRLGAEPTLRRAPGGAVFVTDNHNHILDARFPSGIASARGLQSELDGTPGVVACGLFVGLADKLIIGHEDGSTDVRDRQPPREV
jgi:ribose 5-phosphate isomerase A